MDFARWLKTERAKRRQTQAQLAAAMGYTQAAISKAEDGATWRVSSVTRWQWRGELMRLTNWRR